MVFHRQPFGSILLPGVASPLGESDFSGVRYAILMILVFATAARFQGNDPVEDLQAQPAPPIEIRMGRSAGLDVAEPSALPITMAALPGMRKVETRRYVILSDLEDHEMVGHGRLLERAYHAVELFRSRLELDAHENPTRMLAVAFGGRDRFLKFARDHDEINADWMAGYFAPHSDRLVYFHARDIPSARIAARRIDRLEGRGDEFVAARESLDQFVAQSTAAVVVHEAVHMILHARGIIPAESTVPLWLAEGLAASFEPIAPGRPFGPFQPEGGRTQAFRADLEKDRVPPLEVLVSSTTLPGEGKDMVRRFYDASAAFCGWLSRNEPQRLGRFITAARDGSVGAGRRDRVQAFEEIFGSIESIEGRWLRSERSRIHR